MSAQDWFGFLMVAIQFILLWPLITRLVRSRSSEGIALSGEAMWVFAGLGWAAYGYATGSLPLIVSGLLAAVGSKSVLMLTGAWGADKRQRVMVVCGLTASALGVGAFVSGARGLGVALAVLGVVQFIPQIWVSLRFLATKRGTPGVSPVAALLRVLYSGGWAVFAGAWWLWGIEWYEANWPLVIWGTAGTLAYSLQALASFRNRVEVGAVEASVMAQRAA